MIERPTKELTSSTIEKVFTKSTLTNKKGKMVLNDTIVNHVYSTNNYSKFRLVYGNRELLRRKVIKLREAIKIENKILSYPIVVNSNFQILDGQHRFVALAELGLPVCYIVDDTFKVKTIPKINTAQDKWKSNDYLSAYCTLGYKDYEVFRNFMKTYDTNFTVTLVLFHGKFTGGLYRDFAEGKFTAKHLNRAVKWMDMVQDFKEYIQDIHKDRHFIRAILDCFNHPKYEHERMLKKMKSRGALMTKSVNRLDYLRQIEAMYNWHSPEDSQVRFF